MESEVQSEGRNCVDSNSKMSPQDSFIIPFSVNALIVDTGNLMTFSELKRKASQSSSDELIESVTTTLKECLSGDRISENNFIHGNTAKIVNGNHATSISKEERRNLKITVKVFLGDFNQVFLKEAIECTLKHLTVSNFESLVLSFPPLPSLNKTTLKDMQPLWEVLENLVSKGQLLTIGVSDLDVIQLRELYTWAKVKPSTNQVNLESCCTMPPEMTSFAKENMIQLLTHSDSRVLLPPEGLEKIMSNVVDCSSKPWSTKWIVRYSVQVKCRGIIQSKGYILSVQRQ